MLADENAGLFYQVDWSPDSSQIAFTQKIEGNLHHVKIVDVTDGATRTLLESPNGPHAWLTWSPDGSRIASMSVNNEYADPPQINLIDVQTGEIEYLPVNPGVPMSPAWSPDGRLITFTGEFDGMQGIYVVAADNVDEGPRLIHTERDTGYSWPSWSPDSKQIAVVRNPRASTGSGEIRSTFQVAVVDLDGSTLTVVADNIPLVALAPPAWRPTTSSRTAEEEPTPTSDPTATVEAIVEPERTPTVEPVDDRVRAEQAIALAREFLDDPDSELKAWRIEPPTQPATYHVSRTIEGVPESDLVVVDAETGVIQHAGILSHTTLHRPRNPVTEEEAQRIAETYARAYVEDFNRMELYEGHSDSSGPGEFNSDRLYAASWSLRDSDSGAWLPIWVSMLIDLETGELYQFIQGAHEYDGPTIPVVTQEEAIEIALDQARQDPRSQPEVSVSKVKLWVSPTLPEISDDGSIGPSDLRLNWLVSLNGASVDLMVDAITGDVLNNDNEPDSD